ncbi:hypothetical protein DsansV1_C01g0000261 [Dioscorea sansibarensis]
MQSDAQNSNNTLQPLTAERDITLAADWNQEAGVSACLPLF